MAARSLSMDAEQSEIAGYFNGKNVFITGASGFMGKVLLERLLSACQGVSKVYLLIRSSKNDSPEKRLDQLKQSQVFDKIRLQNPYQMEKLVAINGDIAQPDLGLSAQDKQTLADVNIIFHTAATVRFDDPLKLSVELNVLGTMRMLQLAKSLTKLEVFVHVSTAYANCDRKRVEERVYPSQVNLDQVLAACDTHDGPALEEVTKKMLGSRPNTYTFTKALAEHVVLEHGGTFPIAISRPSIVTAALKHPIPGWVDNANGPTGLLIGAGKGVLRTLHVRRDMAVDLIPVDIAIDTMIAVAWETAVDRPQNIKVYNCVTSYENAVYWSQFESNVKEMIVKHPFSDIVWYPGGSFKDSMYLNQVCMLLFQTIPAYLVDYLAWLLGQKPKLSLIRVVNKMRSVSSSLQFFCTEEWEFVNHNVQALRGRLNPSDRRLFNLDVNTIQWKDYFETYVKGTLKFVTKQQDHDVDKAKKRLKMLFLLHRTMQLALVLLFIRTILSRSQVARSVSNAAIKMSLSLFNNLYKFVSGSAIR